MEYTWVFHLLSLSFTFFRIHDQHSHKPTAFHTIKLYQNSLFIKWFLWPTLQYLQAFDLYYSHKWNVKNKILIKQPTIKIRKKVNQLLLPLIKLSRDMRAPQCFPFLFLNECFGYNVQRKRISATCIAWSLKNNVELDAKIKLKIKN